MHNSYKLFSINMAANQYACIHVYDLSYDLFCDLFNCHDSSILMRPTTSKLSW